MEVNYGLMAIKLNPNDEVLSHCVAFYSPDNKVPENIVDPDACFLVHDNGDQPYGVLHFVGFKAKPTQDDTNNFLRELEEDPEFAYGGKHFDRVVDAPEGVVKYFQEMFADLKEEL